MRGLGTDLVSVRRFNNWHKKSTVALQRVFHDIEIIYCLKDTTRSAERFAVRFAAKEALFKALTQYDSNHKLPFLTLLSCCYVQRHSSGLPIMIVDWQKLMLFFSIPDKEQPKILLTTSHDDNSAIATILLE